MTILIGLLGLGPFLHGHLGASHITGFHVDGLHAADHPAPTGLTLSLGAAEEESPALGVATSLPRSDGGGLLLQTTLLLLAVLCLLPCLRLLRIRPHATELRAVHAYHDGWPPPALAPPLLTA